MGSSKATASSQKKKTKSSTKSSSKTTAKTPATKSPQTFKSSEIVAESDAEDDEPMGTNSSSDSDNDSLPSNPAVKSTPKSKSKSKPNGKAAESSDSSEAETDDESGSGSDSGEDEDEEEDEESEEEDESSGNGNKTTIQPPSKKDANGSSSKTVSLKVVPFKPPTGFESASSKNSSRVAQLFNKSNVEGKEIWYITAPASVPITSVKEMSLQDVKSGKAVFSQNGNDYGFVHDAVEDKTYTKILLPSSSKDGYSIEKRPVDQIYHLQQVANLSKEESSQATVPAKRPVRQQPKGLKARYQPIGFASAPGTIGFSSDEDESDSEERAPKFQKIAMSEDEASDVDMEDAPPASISAKKSKSDKQKKSKKDSEGDVDRSSKKKHKDTADKKKHKKADSISKKHN